VCCLLLSSISSIGRSGELSDFERGLVIGCFISKKSVRDITTLLKLPESTTGDMIVKWKREGTTTMKPQPGRPRLMTDRDRRVLKGSSWDLPDIEWNDHPWVPQCYELPSQHHDYASRLRRMGLHGRNKPNISPVNAKRRLNWCRERRQWTVDNWKLVIRGDESRYTMWWSDGRVWVWRMPGKRYLPACVVPTVKSGKVALQCWWCFSWNGLGPLVILHGNLNAEGYKDILTSCLLSMVEGNGLWIIRLQKWLANPESWPESNRTPVGWIRTLTSLRIATPHITQCSGYSSAGRMGCLSPETFTHLIESLPSRVRAVRQAKGGPTR
jgi:hypothetical protein